LEPWLLFLGFFLFSLLIFAVHLDSSGIRASLEAKVKVLTSQHEDMLFRIRIQAVNLITKEVLEVISYPIKVVSKLKLLCTKKRKISTRKLSSCEERILSDPSVIEKLKEMEKQFKEQNRDKENTDSKDNIVDFESMFWKLLEIYKTLQPEERPNKVRKILSTPGTSQLYIRDFMNSFLTESSFLKLPQF